MLCATRAHLPGKERRGRGLGRRRGWSAGRWRWRARCCWLLPPAWRRPVAKVSARWPEFRAELRTYPAVAGVESVRALRGPRSGWGGRAGRRHWSGSRRGAQVAQRGASGSTPPSPARQLSSSKLEKVAPPVSVTAHPTGTPPLFPRDFLPSLSKALCGWNPETEVLPASAQSAPHTDSFSGGLRDSPRFSVRSFPPAALSGGDPLAG